MKKHLAVIAILATIGGFAKADDKGTEFKFGGEVRQEYYNNQAANLAGGSSGGATTTSEWMDRNQFHVNAISSDKLQAYFDFIHTAVWGGALSVPSNQQPVTNGPGGTIPNGPANGAAVQNALQVSEAWLWWKTSDNTSIRSGRQSMEYGDGLVFSKNDWVGTPYNVDGIMGRMSWDFMDLDLGGGTLADQGTPATGFGTDAQIVFYGFYAQFKGLPDVIKKAEFFVLQTNFDGGLAPSNFAPSYFAGGGALGLTSIGLHAKGDFSIIDYRVDGVYQTGTQKNGNALGSSANFNGNMIDLEVGANFPEFMKGRIFVNYHVDTGDNTTDRTKQNAYQPLFYDRHTYGGMMDMFGFGNLTDIRIGATIDPTEETNFGLEVNLLSRTSASSVGGANSSPTTWLNAGEGNMFGCGNAAAVNAGTAVCTPPGSPSSTANGTNSGLGTEFALHASHNYGHGFSMMAQIAYLTLGNYFTGNGASTTNPMQFVGQAKYAF